jgi:hypothetical protein
MKIFKIFKIYLQTMFQNIPKTFQNKHPINSHPRGRVCFKLSHLHPCFKNTKHDFLKNFIQEYNDFYVIT